MFTKTGKQDRITTEARISRCFLAKRMESTKMSFSGICKTLLICVAICIASPPAFSQPYTEPAQTEPECRQIFFPREMDKIKTIGIVSVNFDSYWLTAGGIREYNDSLSAFSRKNISEAVRTSFEKRGYFVKNIVTDVGNSSDWAKIRHFYDVVNTAIERSMYGYGPLPGICKKQTYYIPPPDRLLAEFDVDALLFVDGFDDRSTNRRRQLKAGAVAGAIAGAVMAAFLGVGVYTSVPPDLTVMGLGLVNSDGQIVWYKSGRKTGYLDMDDESDASKFTRDILKDLKKAGSR